MKYFLITIILLFSFTSLADNSSIRLGPRDSVYNFIIPSTSAGEYVSFFNDCSDNDGLFASSSDEANHIRSIDQGRTETRLSINSDSSGNN